MTKTDFTIDHRPKQSPAVVIKTPTTLTKVNSNVVVFGPSAYVFFDPNSQAYLYGRPAALAAVLRAWANQIDPEVNQ